MSLTAEWDRQIATLSEHAQRVALTHKPDAVFGIAVDDAAKRDYFVPRLQAILDTAEWAAAVTFKVVPMIDGAAPIMLRRETTP